MYPVETEKLSTQTEAVDCVAKVHIPNPSITTVSIQHNNRFTLVFPIALSFLSDTPIIKDLILRNITDIIRVST